MGDFVDFNELKGRTIVESHVKKLDGNDYILFTCKDGERFKMLYDQDCCEAVDIERINGDYSESVSLLKLEKEET